MSSAESDLTIKIPDDKTVLRQGSDTIGRILDKMVKKANTILTNIV